MPDDYQNPASLISIPPPPEEIIRNASGKSNTVGENKSTETVQETPERAAVRGDIAKLDAEHAEVMGQKAAHETAVAGISADFDKARVEAFDAQQAAHAAALKAAQPGIDMWRDKLRESMDNYTNAPSPKLFADKSAPKKLMSAVGYALASIGDAMGKAAAIRIGASTSGWDSASHIIESDLERQRENIKRLDDRVVMAKAGLKDATDSRDLLLAQVDQRGSIAFKRLDLMAQARLSAQGKDKPEIDAALEHLGWKAKSLDLREASVNPLINHVTNATNDSTTKTSEHSDTNNINKPQPGSKVPTGITDLMTGKTLPVDPSLTDERQHNTSVGRLPAVNTVLQTTDKLLKAAEKDGPARAELITNFFGGSTDQAERIAEVTRIRSAYAASKGESVGAHNSKELEAAVPNPPPAEAPRGAWDNWLTKMRSVNNEIHDLRKEYLATAGVPGDVIRGLGTTPTATTPKAPAVPVVTPKATPVIPDNTASKSKRDRTIELLRRNPNYPAKSTLTRLYGISDKELTP